MSILFQINVTANWGSTGRIAEDIGKMVMAHGWESHIAYGRYVNESASHVYHVGNQYDIYSHVLLTRLFDKHGMGSRKATLRLIEHIKKIKPDIIHLHNIHGYYLNYPLLFNYLSKSGIPIVWTLHDCWTLTGHCAHFDYEGCDRWKTQCHGCPLKRTYPASYLADRSANNYREKKHYFKSAANVTLVPVSYWLADFVRDSFLGDKFIHVIHNGVDTGVFRHIPIKKQKYGLEDKIVILGVSSIWTQRKGLDDFIQLRRLLPSSFAIILIGLNKSQIRSLPEGIIGISRTNDVRELVEYYSMADVFVNPTWEDTFPTVNLEALSCGTPVVTYNTGGSPETIDENTGIVVEKGDVEGLATAINTIVDNPMGLTRENCRKRAVKNYNKDIQFNKYFDLYEVIK